MSRSIWKGPYIDQFIWKNLNVKSTNQQFNLWNEKIQKVVSEFNTIQQPTRIKSGDIAFLDQSTNNPHENLPKLEKITNRRSTILPELIGKKYQVYNGNKWMNFSPTQDSIGHKFGEFAWTKKIAQYKRKSKIKKKGKNK
jgi:ribosomal protein S19